MNKIQELKIDIVQRFRNSGLSLRKFAKQEGIPKTTLWNWTKSY